MQKVSWVIVGLLIGMLVATMVPATAHHSRSATRLRDQIDALKTRLSSVESATDANSSSIRTLQSDVSTVKSEISSLKSSISTLTSKTSKLSSTGTYTGTIEGDDIRPSGYCSYGATAVWEFGLTC